MPELPEVETSRRGIEPHMVGEEIIGLTIRDRRLRWPVSEDLDNRLPGHTITSVDRRAKYLLINTTGGTAILHLGMSGHVSIVAHDTPAGIHDHVDIVLASGHALRLRDPRRFGSLHWSENPYAHWLLKDLGPEPLGDEFNGEYLWRKSRGRRVAVKAGAGHLQRAAASNPRRRHDAQGLLRWLRRGRLVPAGTRCLRPGRRALPPLRQAGDSDSAGAARNLLLQEVPDLEKQD
jgi:hypothetical protein